MADVRSMLRNERAARRINHPQAQYTSTGALICKACQIQLKSDTFWQSHVSSAQHVDALKSLAAGLMAQSSTKGTKRKAEADEDTHEEVSRKRNKPTDTVPTEDEGHAEVQQQSEVPGAPVITEKADPGAVDEDEWAAFEREIAKDQEVDTDAGGRIPAVATITAAPVSAAELAARSSDDSGARAKERREAEIEGEKEDAQRRLEEEFDEMEELEARVKRLKEQREALRLRPVSQAPTAPVPNLVEDRGHAVEDGDDSEDDDWDDWGRP